VLEDGNELDHPDRRGGNMFASASDVLQDRYRVPLERVANALNEVDGTGDRGGAFRQHPDQRTARYPSNSHLSLARAATVKEFLAPKLRGSRQRLSAEGRAEREPIASNATPEGRAANRRIEVILIREDT
jgi:type VI secretion system protein ImpK